MDTVVSPTVKRWDWRTIFFVVVAGLFALLLVPGGFLSLLAPWPIFEAARTPGYTPEIHRWHDAQWGALMGILLGGSVLVALWRPRAKPLLMQVVGLGVGILALLGALFDPSILIFLVLVVLVSAAYPAPRTLLNLSRQEPFSRPLLALSGLAAVLLAPGAWRNLQVQLLDHSSEHAVQLHWAHGTILAIVLVLAGLLAATKRPGWQALGIITGLAWFYLGVAALTVPDHDGSWGVGGGLLALLGGVGYLGITVVAARKRHLFRRLVLRRGTLWLAFAAMIGSLVWAGALLALHMLRPNDLERYGDTLSAYGVGPYASLFTAAFVALGLGAAALATGLWHGVQRSIGARAGSWLLGLAGIGFSLVGLFPMAPDLDSIEPAMRGDMAPTTSAIIHGLGGLSGMLFSIAAMLILSRAFKRDERWRSWWIVSLAFGLAALLLLVLSFFTPSPPVVPCCPFGSGAWVKAITMRMFFGTLVAWLLFTALRLRAIVSHAAVRSD